MGTLTSWQVRASTQMIINWWSKRKSLGGGCTSSHSASFILSFEILVDEKCRFQIRKMLDQQRFHFIVPIQFAQTSPNPRQRDAFNLMLDTVSSELPKTPIQKRQRRLIHVWMNRHVNNPGPIPGRGHHKDIPSLKFLAASKLLEVPLYIGPFR